MRLLKLDVKEFGGMFEPTELTLEQRGLVLVEGRNWDAGDSADSNGARKTMLFEMIPWALWGKMPRYGDRRLGNEEIGAADVTVYFELAGTAFRVRRTRTAKGKPDLRVDSLRMPLRGEWIGDGEWVPLSGSKVTADGDMSGLYGFDYETYRSAHMLQATGFGLTMAGFAGQTRLLESVLRLDLLEEAAFQARERCRGIERDHAEAVSHRDQLALQAGGLDNQIKELASLDESERSEQLNKEIDALTKIRNKRNQFYSEKSAAEKALREIQREWATARAAKGAAQQEVNSAQQFFEGDDKVIIACPTCKQPVPNAAHLLKEAQEALDLAIEAEREWKRNEDKALRDLDRIALRLSECQDAATQIEAKTEELEGIVERQRQRQEIMDGAQERLGALRAGYIFHMNRADELRETLLRAQFWSRAFRSDGIRAEILSAAVPVLDAAAQRYSDIMTDGTLKIEFQPLRETKTGDLIRITGPVASRYAGLSRGERRRADLIAALSLRELARWRLARPVNMTLYDEVFDALDEAGLRRIVEVIQRDMDELESTFVITHNPALKALFPGAQVIRVVREGGKSRVEE